MRQRISTSVFQHFLVASLGVLFRGRCGLLVSAAGFASLLLLTRKILWLSKVIALL